MASLIKQRKNGSRNNSPSYQPLSDPSVSSIRHPPSKYSRSVHSITATVVRPLILAALLFSPLRLMLRSTQNYNAHPLSFSALVEKMEKTMYRDGSQYGEITLTGEYTLGEEHLLQNSATSVSEKKTDPITGSIQFPYADLSTVLKEEATEFASQLIMSNFAQSVLIQEGPKSDESFLSDNSRSESAIPQNSALRSPARDDYALLTRRGYKMGDVPNQDRSLIANYFLSGEGRQSKTDKRALLMGIFDGHGPRGHVVSHYIALELPRVFARRMRQRNRNLRQQLLESIGNKKLEYQVMNNVRQALNETFLELDSNEPIKGTGGSTASVLFYPGLGSKVYIANTGDSTTLIARYSKSRKSSFIVYQNRKHKPHLEGERLRIEKAGGQVMIPPSVLEGGGGDGLKETSRVVIPDPNGNPFGGLALAMSRSIGDFDGRPVGLIAEPDVVPWDLNDYYTNTPPEEKYDSVWFAVVASDGVYDLLSPEIVVDYLGRSLHDDHSSIDISPLEACERIILEASRLWMKASIGGLPYRDDITVGVSKINFSFS